MPETLGIKHNNYLNVKNNPGDPWQGSTGSDSHGHAKFQSPEWGLRAAIITMRTYYLKHGLKSVIAILSRWAPVGDANNNPEDYAKFVSGEIGIGKSEDLQLFNADRTIRHEANLRALIRAMAQFENFNGFTFPEEQLDGAIKLVTA